MIDRKELVEKMVGVYEQHGRVCGLDPAKERFFNERRQAMDAALSVAVDELLSMSTVAEGSAIHKAMLVDRTHATAIHALEKVFENRRAQLEIVKTPEERVTVIPTNISSYSNVLLDGNSVGPGSMRNDQAEIYRLGLIAQLKGSA